MRRDLLAEAFGGNPRLVAEFEEQAETVEATSEAAATAVAATETMDQATVLVLSSNTAFQNERVVVAGPGMSLVDADGRLTIRVNRTVPRVEGDRQVTFYATGPTSLVLPVTGTLATTDGAETLSNKHLNKPVLSSWGVYADNSAAAAGAVPVGGVYRTADGTVKVRF